MHSGGLRRRRRIAAGSWPLGVLRPKYSTSLTSAVSPTAQLEPIGVALAGREKDAVMAAAEAATATVNIPFAR